jgi:hypothetical protein
MFLLLQAEDFSEWRDNPKHVHFSCYDVAEDECCKSAEATVASVELCNGNAPTI